MAEPMSSARKVAHSTVMQTIGTIDSVALNPSQWDAIVEAFTVAFTPLVADHHRLHARVTELEEVLAFGLGAEG